MRPRASLRRGARSPRRLRPDRIRQSPRPSREIARQVGILESSGDLADRLERLARRGDGAFPQAAESRRDQEVALDDGRLPDLRRGARRIGRTSRRPGRPRRTRRGRSPARMPPWPRATRSPSSSAAWYGALPGRLALQRAAEHVGGDRQAPEVLEAERSPRPSGRRAGRTPATSAAAGRPRGRSRCRRSSFALPGPTVAARCLQPAAPPEVERQHDEHHRHQAEDRQERERLVLAGTVRRSCRRCSR